MMEILGFTDVRTWRLSQIAMKASAFLTLALILCMRPSLARAGEITLTDGFVKAEIRFSGIEYVEDKEGHLTLEDVMAARHWQLIYKSESPDFTI